MNKIKKEKINFGKREVNGEWAERRTNNKNKLGLLFPLDSHPDFDIDNDKLDKVKMLAHPRLVNKDINERGSFNLSLKVILSLAILLIILIVQIHQISSLGITPGRTNINFAPGLSQEVSFSIVNTENKDMSVVFFVRGALNSSVALKQAYAEFSASENSKSFSYRIDLPEKIEKPGLYETEIVALEMPKNFKEQGTFVGATVAVVTQLHVYVPYPNKYLDADMNIITDDNGKIVFLVPAINRGKLDIVNAKAVIDIYTALNEKVATIETNTESINSLMRTELSAEWEPKVNPGKYLAVATILYDNERAEIQKEFNVGEALVEIKEVVVRDFQLGEIAKFNALVENRWGNEIKEVFLNILVYNNDQQIMADFKSPNYDLKPLSTSEMVAYWDTTGVHRGEYDGKLILRYGAKSAEKNIHLKISENDIEISGLTGRVLVRGKGGMSTNTLIIVLIVVLIAVNAVWFAVVKRMIKKRK
ncbi:hypothetical protein HYT23_01295 [Candidatus Pacearchaeota archaeon]|nr:hypothetical protein [Candidatus Pacearchaeota archaeon]